MKSVFGNSKQVPGFSKTKQIPGISKTKHTSGGKLFGKQSHNALGNKSSLKKILK